MARAPQMVDVLTEENRMLRQEMEACREKVTKLHKVTTSGKMLSLDMCKPVLKEKVIYRDVSSGVSITDCEVNNKK